MHSSNPVVSLPNNVRPPPTPSRLYPSGHLLHCRIHPGTLSSTSVHIKTSRAAAAGYQAANLGSFLLRLLAPFSFLSAPLLRLNYSFGVPSCFLDTFFAPFVTPLKRLHSLSKTEAAISNPKFGAYIIIYIYVCMYDPRKRMLAVRKGILAPAVTLTHATTGYMSIRNSKKRSTRCMLRNRSS